MTTTSAANTIIPARIDYIRLPPNEWTAPSDVYVTTKLVDHSVVSLRFLSQKSTAQRKRQHKNICTKDRNRSKRRPVFPSSICSGCKYLFSRMWTRSFVWFDDWESLRFLLTWSASICWWVELLSLNLLYWKILKILSPGYTNSGFNILKLGKFYHGLITEFI